MQSVFHQLIEEQTKTLMLAKVSEGYIFKTLTPAKVTEEKAKPKRALIFVLCILLAGILSVLIVLIRYFSVKSKKEFYYQDLSKKINYMSINLNADKQDWKYVSRI